jgi:hypothetical protein
MAKPAHQQRSVQLSTQKRVKYFFEHLTIIIPRYDVLKMEKDCSKNEIILLKNSINNVKYLKQALTVPRTKTKIM